MPFTPQVQQAAKASGCSIRDSCSVEVDRDVVGYEVIVRHVYQDIYHEIRFSDAMMSSVSADRVLLYLEDWFASCHDMAEGGIFHEPDYLDGLSVSELQQMIRDLEVQREAMRRQLKRLQDLEPGTEYHYRYKAVRNSPRMSVRGKYGVRINAI